MQHPNDFLTRNSPLNPDQWRLLILNATTIAFPAGPHPDKPCFQDDEIIFTFEAHSILDNHDMSIAANKFDGTFHCLQRPHCACLQDNMDCQCHETQCFTCGLPLVAVTSVCYSEFCVNDDCPLCSHQRETCHYEQIKENIRLSAAETTLDQPNLSDAMAYVGAVGEILAPGVGDAPIFPATVRILDSLLGGNHSTHDLAESMKHASWTCPDGSTISQGNGFQGWLEASRMMRNENS